MWSYIKKTIYGPNGVEIPDKTIVSKGLFKSRGRGFCWNITGDLNPD